MTPPPGRAVDPRRSGSLRPLGPACLLTTLEFPLLYRELRDDADPLAIGVLYARDLLLIAAAGLSATRLWRATASGRVTRPAS